MAVDALRAEILAQPGIAAVWVKPNPAGGFTAGIEYRIGAPGEPECRGGSYGVAPTACGALEDARNEYERAMMKPR